MKRILALILLCCFTVTGCGGTAKAVEEEIWTNEAYAEETYDVIVVGTEPEGIAAAVSEPAMA